MIVRASTPEERVTLVSYIASKIGTTPMALVGNMPFEVLGVMHGDTTKGAILYINKRGTTIEMTWAGEKGWLQPQDVRHIWAYPFEQLDCLTALGLVRETNTKSIELSERLGCERVGTVSHAFGKDEHGILFQMTRDRCRWLKEQAHG